jgi:hypothetical protein
VLHLVEQGGKLLLLLLLLGCGVLWHLWSKLKT